MSTTSLFPQGRVGGASELDRRVPTSREIHERLKDFIGGRGPLLKDMYGKTGEDQNRRLRGPVKIGEEIAKKLIKGMGCTGEVAKDLAVLTLYDVVILIDDSSSMISEDNGQRKEALARFIDHITEIYSMVNESGILAIRFMNRAGGRDNWTGKSHEYLDHHIYGGVTRIGTALNRILEKFVTGNHDQNKPLLVLIVTDGATEGERKGHLRNVIQDCINERQAVGKGRDAISFQFSCIGNDPGATQLFAELNHDPDLRACVDWFLVGSSFERQLEDMWFVLPKILLGAILPGWREQDDQDL